MKKRASTALFAKYPPHYNFGGKRTLNLGCGYCKYPSPNVVNLDAYGDPDVTCNLDDGVLPFENESFDHVVANHILEHIGGKGWWQIFNECARILKPNGKMEVYLPGDGTDAIFGFRDHISDINACSFFGTFQTYRAGGNAWADEQIGEAANRMKIVELRTYLENFWWLKGPNSWKDWCKNHLRNVVREKGFLFRKVTNEEWAKEQANYEESKGRTPAVLRVQQAGI